MNALASAVSRELPLSGFRGPFEGPWDLEDFLRYFDKVNLPDAGVPWSSRPSRVNRRDWPQPERRTSPAPSRATRLAAPSSGSLAQPNATSSTDASTREMFSSTSVSRFCSSSNTSMRRAGIVPSGTHPTIRFCERTVSTSSSARPKRNSSATKNATVPSSIGRQMVRGASRRLRRPSRAQESDSRSSLPKMRVRSGCETSSGFATSLERRVRTLVAGSGTQCRSRDGLDPPCVT